MFKRTIITATLALVASAQTFADYQAELSANRSETDIETLGIDSDFDVYSVGGSFYFTPVDTSKGPLSEAVFVDRASSISASYSDGEIDTIIGDFDMETYSLSGRWVDKNSGWLIEAGYTNADFEGEDVDTYSVGIGKYITENTTLTLSYIDSDEDVDGYGLALEHLCLMGDDQALKLDAAYARTNADNSDDVDAVTIGATFYFTRNFGIGAIYSESDSDLVQIETVGVAAEWFITEQFAISVGYTETEDDEINSDADTIVAGARVRF